jgi:hypothetical protein
MRLGTRLLAVFLLLGVVLSGAAFAPVSWADDDDDGEEVIPFDVVQIFIEYNATDDDAGIQVFFDGEAWKEVEIFNPQGRLILELEARRGFKRLGLTEMRFESAEPSLPEVLALFPPGAYKFEGETIDGKELQGTARLAHEIPPAPVFSPSDGAVVDRNNTVITWERIPGVRRYQVIVEQEDLGVMLTVDLRGAANTSLLVPPTFLRPDTEYKAEVLAILANGNRTITESTFRTLP